MAPRPQQNNPHRPSFSIEETRNRVAVSHTTLSSYVNSLLTTLNNKNNKPAYEFVSDLEAQIDRRNGNGILTQITNPADPTHQKIDFNFLKWEVIYLDELKNLKIDEINSSLIPEMQKALLTLIKKEIKAQLPPTLKTTFEDYTLNQHDINGLLNDLDLFANLISNPKQKSSYLHTKQNFSLSFFALKNQLKTQGIDMRAVENDDFQKWPSDTQQLFDGLMSKTVISRLQKRMQLMWDLLNGMQDIFNNTLPPLSTLLQKYPFNYEALALAYPNEWQIINDLQDTITEDSSEEQLNLIRKQIHEKQLELYFKDLKNKNPALGTIMVKLYHHNFDFTILDPKEQSDFFWFLAEYRLEALEHQNLIKLFDEHDPEAFKHYFKELFDLGKDTIDLGGVQLKINKSVNSNTLPSNFNLEDMAVSKDIPLEFTLTWLSSTDFSPEQRQLFTQLFGTSEDSVSLSGTDIGKLLYLYLVSKKPSLINHYSPERAKQRLDQIIPILNHTDPINLFRPEQLPPKPSEDTPSPESPDPDREKRDHKEELLTTRDSIKWEKSTAEDHGFAPWAIIFFNSPLFESLLPPYSTPSNEWMRMEITHVDWDAGIYKAKTYGWEIQLNTEDEWVEKTYPIASFKEHFGDENSHMGASFKMLANKKDKNEINQAFQAAGMFPDFLKELKFEGNKILFDHQNNEGKNQTSEAIYFGCTDDIPDPNSSALKKHHILYKIQAQGNWKFEVSSDFVDLEWEKRRYEKTMTYPDLLLFLSQKKLTPKTKEQAQAEKLAMEDILSKKNRKRKWVSVASMIFSIKNVWKNLTGKIDEFYKEQDEACLDWLVSDFGIYKWIENKFGFFDSVKSAAGKLHDEQLAKKEKNTRKSIENWISKFKGMQDFSALFADGADHPSGIRIDSAIGKGNTLKSILLSGKSVVEDKDLRPIMAAALIANIRQGKGLYRWLSNMDNKGLWVKCLLGDQHHQRYMNMRNDVMAKIKAWAADSDQLQDRLKKSEIEYIVNNIQNANGGSDFWSVSDRNAQALKQLYSWDFANELNSAASDLFGMGAIDWAYGKIWHNNFNLASSDFKRFITSSRIEPALANLKKMGDLAKTPRQQNELKMALSYVTLSGIMNRYGDKKVRKWFDQLARTYMLPTAFFAKKWNNQRSARHLLNNVPPASWEKGFLDAMKEEKSSTINGKTTVDKGIKESDFSMHSGDVPYKKLLDRLWAWWHTNASAIDNYFLSLQSKDASSDPIEKAVQDQYWTKDGDNVDANWSANPGITGHYAILASPEVIFQNKRYTRDGLFEGKEPEDRNDKADFWKTIKSKLESAETQGAKPEFFLQLFLKWFKEEGFSESSYPEHISWIKTAQAVRKQHHSGRWIGFDVSRNDIDDLDESNSNSNNITINMGSYKKDDSKSLLQYLFKGHVLDNKNYPPPAEFAAVLDFFVNYFDTNLHRIDDTTLKNAFGRATDLPESKPLILIPRDEYNKHNDKNSIENFFNQGQNDKNKKKAPDEKRKARFYKSNTLFLNARLAQLEKKLSNKGISMPTLAWSQVEQGRDFFRNAYGA